jgi:23S rRNA (uracil1939-C5)-methyltransferase
MEIIPERDYVFQVFFRFMETILKIEKLVHGGLGLSRTERGIVFVADVLPGETVRAVMERPSGGQTHAVCAEVIEPSVSRRLPPCPLSGVCGGCDWLHIEYQKQLSIKKEIFRECLVRTGKIKDIPDITAHASPEFGYRRRVQVKIDRVKGTAGFYKKKSNEVVSVSHCPLLCDSLNHFLSRLPNHLSTLPKNTEQVKAVAGTLQHPHEAFVGCSSVASSPVIQGLTAERTVIQVESFHFSVAGSSFFQSNIFLCGPLGRFAAEWLEGESFCDLYGGAGFFSAFVAPRFFGGTLVDNEESHVAEARRNLAENGIATVSSIAQTAAGFVEALGRGNKKPTCIIVDPPRTGMDERVRFGIAKILPPVILYVSCDPATQARDAGFFVNTHGYRIEKAALFDFYPQTHHLETALLLKR